jgi:hypothetical protein
VERVIEQFIQQTYPEKELIIFNTDVEHPMELSDDLTDLPIIVINNDIDYETGEPYTNRGAICRDAVTHATGEYFMLADDDDVYLPWHIQQAVESIELNGTDAWKPQKSIFATGNRVEFTQNTLEASVIVKMSRIREIGFRTDMTGYEGLSWYTKLRDERQLNEYDSRFVASYCFNWSDPGEIAGHKQSGDINNPDNFENHKLSSIDFARRPLARYGQAKIEEFYRKYYEFLEREREAFPQELWEKYVGPHISSANFFLD